LITFRRTNERKSFQHFGLIVGNENAWNRHDRC
jgi:hypothetical protein